MCCVDLAQRIVDIVVLGKLMIKNNGIHLYLDGLSAATAEVFARHLETINRLSRYEDGGIKSWETTDNAEVADLLFLGQNHHVTDPLHLNRPILFDGKVPSALSGVAISVQFPMTSMALKELMQDTIANFKPVTTEESKDDSKKITIHLPDRKPHVSVVTQKSTIEQHTTKQVHITVPDRVVHDGEDKKTSIRSVQRSSPDKEETTSTNKQEPVVEQQEIPVANIAQDVPFFEGYLHAYPPKDQVHTLTYADGKKIYINRLQGKVFADCGNIRELVQVLSSIEQPKLSDFSEQPTELRIFPFDAVLWSYGLHAPLSVTITKKFDIKGQKARLKRWPLFGKWETDSKLLFLTTLFTQKPVSLREATVKSGQDKDFVLHFIAAAEWAGLPFDLVQSTETEDTPITEKKKVGWINSLREKLNMNHILSGN